MMYEKANLYSVKIRPVNDVKLTPLTRREGGKREGEREGKRMLTDNCYGVVVYFILTVLGEMVREKRI